ncbi:2Fe-2S iron-sulfur cluster-binding protein [Prochlorococcus sp. MIT 1223]|uniref:2Fe-2S iron-sulfur cluster-binding protein n=1 Tax=Prochlorococcus sp. MIT 1223 TaxID=3096217 RepID=UPI002A74BB55|nr:2Fe-2S iron-sulfur cluster-binding protein [Prochlorococcus sp. MIT 1223]
MKSHTIQIKWPNGVISNAEEDQDWLMLARESSNEIPVGCLNGSCGACEIEVNGEVIRACVSTIKKSKSGILKVNFYQDPYW